MSFWKDRPVFVTGSTGFLGGHLVDRLLDEAADVVCLVRDANGKGRLLNSGAICDTRIVRGDVTDQALLERILGEYEVETVFHLAAQTVVGVANRNPVSTLDSNVRGTWALLEACRRSPKVRQVVVASSDKAYGEQPTLPYTEDMPLLATHPYDASKACADMLTRCYARTYGLPACVTRCGNLFGPGDLHWNRLVPGTIRSVLRGERPVIRSDGKMIRDCLFAKDAAAAYLLLAECMGNSRTPGALHGEAFNFSMEQPLPVAVMAGLVLSAMGKEIKLDVRNEASNEIPKQCLSCEKARQVLGWKPAYALEEAMRETISWYEGYLG